MDIRRNEWHEKLNKICLIFNIIALAINVGCLILGIIILIRSDFKDPGAPIMLTAIIIFDICIVILNCIEIIKNKVKKVVIFSLFIAVDLLLKDLIFIIPAIDSMKALTILFILILLPYEILNLILQIYKISLLKQNKE